MEVSEVLALDLIICCKKGQSHICGWSGRDAGVTRAKWPIMFYTLLFMMIVSIKTFAFWKKNSNSTDGGLERLKRQHCHASFSQKTGIKLD